MTILFIFTLTFTSDVTFTLSSNVVLNTVEKDRLYSTELKNMLLECTLSLFGTFSVSALLRTSDFTIYAFIFK